MYKKLRENYTVEDLVTDESFINYFLRLDAADVVNWELWIASHPEHQEVVEKAGEVIGSLSITLSENEYHHELGRITTSIEKQPAKLFSLPGRNRFSFRGKRKAILYLVPAILIIIAVVWFINTYQKNDPTITAQAATDPLRITLSDSTVVTLAPNSALRFPRKFKNNNRDVFLEGDADFSVKRNEKAPFKVYAEKIVATVLGTTFSIKKSGDSALVVDLLTGALSLEIKDSTRFQPIMLAPNERAVYVKSKNRFYKQPIVVTQTIRFYQDDFKTIAEKFKQGFGVTLINQSNQHNWSFTGEFNGATAKEIIESISLVRKLSYGIVGDTILIK